MITIYIFSNICKLVYLGERIIDDLDTVGKNSKITEDDYKNEHSAAGYLNRDH